MSGSTPFSPTGRREAILDAALRLFHRSGFHSVGIDEIGTAAGISGPGVYRHFSSKSSLLVALFDSISERALAAAGEIQKSDGAPAEVLDRLVDYHVATAFEERSLLAVWIRDWRSLPTTDQQRIRQRQAEYIAIWVAALVQLRPALDRAEAEAVVHAAIGAVNSVALHDTGLGREALEPLLGEIARTVLRTG